MLEKEDILLLANPVILARVKDFDESRGIGHLICGEYGKDIFFHCTQLSDKTRHVEVGRKVCAEVKPGKTGILEAYNIVKL